MTDKAELPRVVYIAGAGRSGSTLLDILLAGHDDACGVGELINLPRNFMNDQAYCACGASLQACAFWTKVEKLWRQDTGETDFHRFQGLRLDLHRYRRLPGLLWSDAKNRNTDFRAYIDLIQATLRAVTQVSGRKIIIDSSKEPARMLALGNIAGLDLRVLHLTRDPRGVAWSRTKTALPDPSINIFNTIKGQAAWRTAGFWSVINVATEAAARSIGRSRYLRMRYEDLMTKPAESLKRIASFADMDLDTVIANLERGTPIAASHTVAGNRLRMQKFIKLKLDDAWRDLLPYGDRLATTALTLPLLLRYGYSLVVQSHG